GSTPSRSLVAQKTNSIICHSLCGNSRASLILCELGYLLKNTKGALLTVPSESATRGFLLDPIPTKSPGLIFGLTGTTTARVSPSQTATSSFITGVFTIDLDLARPHPSAYCRSSRSGR